MALANAVYDHVPNEPFGSKTAYISFGPTDSVEDDAECITGLETTIQMDVWSKAVGAVECKRLTDLVRKALHRKTLVLTDNAIVDVWVTLTRTFPDASPGIMHGVIQATFSVEEPD